MNLIVDVYDYTDEVGNELAWEGFEFPRGVPLPLVGELFYLPKTPDALPRMELIPFMVTSRSFYLQRSRYDQSPQMRVAILVKKYEEAEYG